MTRQVSCLVAAPPSMEMELVVGAEYSLETGEVGFFEGVPEGR